LVAAADVVVVLGCSLNDRTVGHLPKWPPAGTVVRVDAKAETESVTSGLSIRTSVGRFCDCFLQSCDFPTARMRRSAPDVMERRRSEAGLLSITEVIRAIGRCDADCLVTDSGTHKYWVRRFLGARTPRGAISSSGFGSMGFGLPAAIGAAIANPTRRVVAVCGDGGALMAVQELRTARTYQCRNLKLLIINDGGLNSTREYELRDPLTEGRASLVSDFAERVSFRQISESLGVPAMTVTTSIEGRALEKALSSEGLLVIDCHIEGSRYSVVDRDSRRAVSSVKSG
jgi:acetolactate synthase I/II/III large subunit